MKTMFGRAYYAVANRNYGRPSFPLDRLTRRPFIIDTCIGDNFALDPRIIPTAMHHPYRDLIALAAKLHGKRVVVYCHRGKNISQGEAAILRDANIENETLVGIVAAWSAADAPFAAVGAIQKLNATGRTVWITL